ncbi:MAG TPA: hypothetical protein VM370_07480 [Candidatus Thermoplasmatota archaeon]|nr:hypothetical protein [Candidatus Thermoplasmatota archaeon]
MRLHPGLVTDTRRAAPYALLLALGLGAVVVAGAHYSNAFPSEKAPFGWPGPSSFEHAVAMVRSDLILAASLPALALGAFALRGREPAREGVGGALRTYGVHAAMLAVAVLVAGILGAIGAAKAPFDAVFAFWTAHTVLALAFYSIAFAWSCWLKEHALAGAAAMWIGFLGLYESVTRTILFRQVGYERLAAGDFPTWFWAAQGLSPLSSYTGILILWREKFRDYTETAVLANAALPSWLVPATFVALATMLWILLPLSIGLAGWWWRARTWSAARVTRAEPA